MLPVIDLLFVGRALNRHKKMIIAFSCVCFVVGFINAKCMPTAYRTHVDTLLPGELSGGGGGGGGLARYLGLPSLSVGRSSYDTIIYIVKSTRMAEDIVEHFNLASNPQEKRSVVNTIRQNVQAYKINDGAGLRIQVTGLFPEKLPAIANFCVENLDHINAELEITSRKPMLRLLDAAPPAYMLPKNTKKKMLTAGLGGLMIISILALGYEYLKLCRQQKAQAIMSKTARDFETVLKADD